MTKRELDELVLNYANAGAIALVEQHGDFMQRATVVDRRGKHHLIVMTKVHHAREMRPLLTGWATAVGGADALLVQSDARFKEISLEEIPEMERAIERGEHRIAEDTGNREALITGARSREHVSVCVMRYKRKPGPRGDIVVFDDPTPHVEKEWQGQANIIPDVWEEVH